MSCPSVYIVVINWNGYEDTSRCLTSLRDLEYPTYRIIVIDNGSDDGSVELLRKNYPNVIILEAKENVGFARGNNIGIRYALNHYAAYVWLLNNDTTVSRTALFELVQVAESDVTIGAVGSVVYYMNCPEKIQVWGGGWVNTWIGRAGHFITPVPSQRLDYVVGASILLRSDALRDVGYLDEDYFMYWEDTDISFRLRKAGWKLAVAPNSKVFHKVSGSIGEGSEAFHFYFNRSAKRFFQRYCVMPWVPISIGVGGRLAKLVVKKNWKAVRAIVRSMFVPSKI
ncbi:glycosyltransferase family 2 protein [Kyrpidia spormannii]|uniref:Glycosyltransferase family 2 protein n=1 Tax=Kyrpidia spormannii TaxID=2055160 RepID=A0A2K8N2U8_9BACL|nr:glycosyltransferase family 2 protein [Kyrpidia spormannii]ATY83851.1 glycosyltransferase family 2 protein [Kyrpidia spormannii]